MHNLFSHRHQRFVVGAPFYLIYLSVREHCNHFFGVGTTDIRYYVIDRWGSSDSNCSPAARASPRVGGGVRPSTAGAGSGIICSPPRSSGPASASASASAPAPAALSSRGSSATISSSSSSSAAWGLLVPSSASSASAARSPGRRYRPSARVLRRRFSWLSSAPFGRRFSFICHFSFGNLSPGGFRRSCSFRCRFLIHTAGVAFVFVRAPFFF